MTVVGISAHDDGAAVLALGNVHLGKAARNPALRLDHKSAFDLD